MFTVIWTVGSQQLFELINRQPHFSNDGSQCALGYFFMIRHNDAAMGRLILAKHQVAPTLPVERIAQCGERLHDLSARHDWQFAHGYTSTTSSEIGGGIGSPCASRLSI